AAYRGLEPAVQKYLVIFGLLMLGLVLTVIAARIPLGPMNLTVALMIGGAKALLVVLYFMHVKEASKLTWVFAGAAFMWLAIMIALTFGDYLTRDNLPYSVHQNTAVMVKE